MIEPTRIAVRDLLARYDGVLLDVFGVLLDASGPLPGARELIAELDRRAQPYAVVTNDASRSADTYVGRFAGYGIAIAADRFVTSGSLLPGYLREHALAGARTMVLGTADSFAYVRDGGALALAPDAAGSGAIDAIAVCDDDGYEFLSGIEHALSAIVRAVEAGRSPALILPNPDLVYPKGNGELGFTAGAVALLLEAALARRFPGRGLAFVHLGKPEPRLFAEAARRLAIAPARLVMIGDQLETDIAGAHAAGMATALVAGVTSWAHARATARVAPQYVLETLVM
jgi:HAD superfamily hydrolase (TIGR01450 family)